MLCASFSRKLTDFSVHEKHGYNNFQIDSESDSIHKSQIKPRSPGLIITDKKFFLPLLIEVGRQIGIKLYINCKILNAFLNFATKTNNTKRCRSRSLLMDLSLQILLGRLNLAIFSL